MIVNFSHKKNTVNMKSVNLVETPQPPRHISPFSQPKAHRQDVKYSTFVSRQHPQRHVCLLAGIACTCFSCRLKVESPDCNSLLQLKTLNDVLEFNTLWHNKQGEHVQPPLTWQVQHSLAYVGRIQVCSNGPCYP